MYHTFDGSSYVDTYLEGDFRKFFATAEGTNWHANYIRLQNYGNTNSKTFFADADGGNGRFINYLELGWNSDIDLISTNINVITGLNGAIHDISLGSGNTGFINLAATRNIVTTGSGYNEFVRLGGESNTVTVNDGWINQLNAAGTVANTVNVGVNGWVGTLKTADGNDRVTVEGSVGFVDSGAGDDKLVINNSVQFIRAGDGDDTIVTRANWISNAQLGAGDDRVVVAELAPWSDIHIHGSGNAANGVDTLDFSKLATGSKMGIRFDLGVGTGYQEIYRAKAIDAWVSASGMENLIGTKKKDILIASSKDNELTGGKGADVFVFGKNGGDDTVTDFQPDIDTIRIKGHAGGFATLAFDHVTKTVTHDGGTISFDGIDTTQLDSADFHFV
jgi:hypothetical protein